MKKTFLYSFQLKRWYVVYFLIAVFATKAYPQSYVKKAGFNTSYDETSPSFYKSGLIYASNRKNKLIKNYMSDEEHYTYDLFFEKRDTNYAEIKGVLQVLNSPLDEAGATFNKTFDTVYFSRTYSVNPERKNSEIKSGLFFSYKKGDSLWTEPRALPFNDANYNLGQPSLSTSGVDLYFISDQKGIGNADIWVSHKNRQGVWSKPENVGAPINSVYSEISPFIYKDSILYFSSYKRKDKGFDVYKYNLNKKKFLPLDIPSINTEKNQFGFIRNDKKGDFYWVSDFEGDKNIMLITLDSLFSKCTYPTTTNYCRHFMVERELDSSIVLHWDFGDSTTATGLEIEHCYKKEGVYDVVLDVVDVTTDIRYEEVAGYSIEVKEEPLVNIKTEIEPIHPVLVTELSSAYEGNSELWIWKSKFTGTISYEPVYSYYPSYNVVDSLMLLVYDLQNNQPICSGKSLVVSEQVFGEKAKIALNKNSILADMKKIFPTIDETCAGAVEETKDLKEYTHGLLSCTKIEYEISLADEKNGYLLLELNKKAK